MTAATPTFSQIKAQVAAIRRKVAGARVFGIQTAGRWTDDRPKTDGTDTFSIVQCDSPLQMRVALQDNDPAVTAKVLVTNLSPEQVEQDIRVRLAKRTFLPINSWQIVKDLFQAQRIDPRIAAHSWIADLLLESPDGYPPVMGGFLDAETVWGILLDRQIGLSVAQPDLIALLKWSMEQSSVDRYRSAPPQFREAATSWITQFAGPSAQVILSCVEANDRPDAVPIGLALGVVFSSEAAGRLDKAAGRMEQFTGGIAIDEVAARRWQAAATEIVSLHLPDPKVRRAWLDRADELLRLVQADEFAYLSKTSPLGFDQRLARYGMALVEACRRTDVELPRLLAEFKSAILEHDQAKQESRRLQQVEMSLRLARWLVSQRSTSRAVTSFVDAVQRYAVEGGFVDWARQVLRSGEPVRELSEAYATLRSSVTEIRERQNKQFAELLRDWTIAGSSAGEVVLIERVLDDVVAPLAAQAPILVLVIDGMSYAVFRELIEDITRQDWVELRERKRPYVRPAIAGIPSVTEVSRTSLFCGELRQGNSNDEAIGFAQHSGLLAASRAGVPPVLFHKVALQETSDASLAATVRDEIASTRRRIVGVVINAVDDHLLKGDQLNTRWSREEIRVLPTLLYEAKAAGRLVVLLSDHGHVLEHQTEFRKFNGGERWRPDDGQPLADELQVSGYRVVLPANHRLIAPWSENVRYGMKKNGYHGGISPQEMVIPLTVLSANDELPDGWTEPTVQTPVWWDEPRAVSSPTPPAAPAKAQKPKQPKTLFDLEPEKPRTPSEVVPTPPRPQPWLENLLVSPTLAEQKKLCGRTVPPDEIVRKLLTSLSEHGGKMTTPALARKMEVPPFRLRGLLAVIQRLLNVDGYPILTKDEASDTIELNRELAERQFDPQLGTLE